MLIPNYSSPKLFYLNQNPIRKLINKLSKKLQTLAKVKNYKLCLNQIYLYIQNQTTMNNNANQQENNRSGTSRSKQIIFIIVIYFMLVMSSKFSNKSEPNTYQKAVNTLKADMLPNMATLLGIFQIGTVYEGRWQKLPSSGETQKQSLYFQNQGKSKTEFTVLADNQVSFALMIENGDYLDDGYLYTIFDLHQQQNKTFVTIRKQGNSAILTFQTVKALQNTTLPTTTYKIQKIFNTVQISITTIQKVAFNFTLVGDDIVFEAQVQTAKFKIKSSILGKQSFMIRTIFFAFLAFVISYFSFNSVLQILRKIIEGSQSAEKYSLMTVLVATLWDSILCLVCFIQAFSNEQNLILFILPSFMLCILFTNLQLRWMLSIFQSGNNTLDLRTIICRFNLISYGSFLLVYPILLFTNLNQWLFIGISLIFLPQIYVNAQKGIRPDLNHPYYSKFLMMRFMIVFYVRGFPYNVFQLRPDYLLCLVCLALISLQYALLWVQKIYGPKTIFPKFMLPPVFDYKLQEQINIEEGADFPQCAICLTVLHQDPDLNEQQLRDPGYTKERVRLMKTPCNHKYHSKCLQQWMNIKKECPQCRKVLPPFE